MNLPILCYHKIGPEREEGRSLNVEPQRLDSHLRFFLKKGFKAVNCRDFRTGFDHKTVILTFDDAYESAMAYGLEVLQRHNAVGTFYAVPGLVGQASAWDPGKERPLADWATLRKAQATGMEIGNHTNTHALLTELDPGQERDEWMEADRLLRRNEIDVTTACYPYGALNAQSVALLSGMGYIGALALGKRWASAGDEKFALPRIVVAFSDAVPKLLYKLYVRPHLPR